MKLKTFLISLAVVLSSTAVSAEEVPVAEVKAEVTFSSTVARQAS